MKAAVARKVILRVLLLVCITSTFGAEKSVTPSVSAGTIRVAGIVLKWLRGDKEGNFNRIEPLIREAVTNGAQIVSTTECFLDGYAIADKSIPLNEYRDLGEPIPGGKYFEKLARLAKELNILLVAGMLEADGDARFNTAVTIGRDGKLVGKYRKQKLEHESVRNTPGTESLVFATCYGNLGVMICADRRFPDVVKRFSEAGADFLICPSGGMFGPKSNDHILQARSRENRKHIVFVHPAEFLVTSPEGEIASQAILGDRLLISRDQIDSEVDSKKVFYFDLPVSSR
jgi:predicted amidohydrolase